ncbi:hypothetical protein NC796_21305 [Aliifodinibius sp. S!AR15-10]|uniref:hypothetical protein n=1 Tax=Aliifodinibius sp. S!AR15-10 TaxID=2950437 RepID=UPI00286788A8|nr:hypothetical protein [Aliifodinibius sp. S!AR15-10]MDR8393705.1 hypothetical protein [Aliifodinibius sp. S!AR15-10]
MKTANLALSVLLCLFTIVSATVQAQEKPMGQLYAIHEDVVYPSKVQHYEETAKNLANLFREHQIGSMSYTTANTMDFTYIYITPLKSLADVEKMDMAFAELQDKIGDEAFEEAMGAFSDCYDSHRNYMVRMRSDLSYKPEYGNNPNDGMNYRSWEFYHVYPGKEAQMEEMAMKWKNLYTKHNIAEGYRIYLGDMGTEMPLLIVVQSAKNAVDHATKSEKIMKTLGEEGESLWYETMAMVRKIEQKTGMIRPDLSYTSGQLVTVEE